MPATLHMPHQIFGPYTASVLNEFLASVVVVGFLMLQSLDWKDCWIYFGNSNSFLNRDSVRNPKTWFSRSTIIIFAYSP